MQFISFILTDTDQASGHSQLEAHTYKYNHTCKCCTRARFPTHCAAKPKIGTRISTRKAIKVTPFHAIKARKRHPAAPAIERSISCISTWRFHALCKATRAHHLSKRSERAFFFEAVPLKATATHWAACADAKTSPARQRSPRRSSRAPRITIASRSNGPLSYCSLFVTRGKAPEPGSLLCRFQRWRSTWCMNVYPIAIRILRSSMPHVDRNVICCVYQAYGTV